jgi:tetratricopeptide (TPR) repeat protein
MPRHHIPRMSNTVLSFFVCPLMTIYPLLLHFFFSCFRRTGSIGVALPAVIVLSMFANIDAAFSAPAAAARSHAPPAAHSNSAATIWALGKVRLFLEWTLVPLFAIALQLPQGALCYWAGSSAFALAQNRLLKFPAVRAAAGLHTAAGTPSTQATPTTLGTTEINAQHSTTTPTASATATPQNRVASEDIAALFLQAAELQAKGAGSEAAAVLERVLAAHPGHPRALFAQGQVRSGLKDWEGAGHSYLQAAKNEDEEPAQRCRAWFGAGVALHMVQREEDALAAFRNAAAPEAEERLRVRAWVSAAALHEKLGSVGEAITLLRKAAEVEPKVEEVYLQPLLKKNA